MCGKEEALGNRRGEPIIETVQWRFAFEFHTSKLDVRYEPKTKEMMRKKIGGTQSDKRSAHPLCTVLPHNSFVKKRTSNSAISTRTPFTTTAS